MLLNVGRGVKTVFSLMNPMSYIRHEQIMEIRNFETGRLIEEVKIMPLHNENFAEALVNNEKFAGMDTGLGKEIYSVDAIPGKPTDENAKKFEEIGYNSDVRSNDTARIGRGTEIVAVDKDGKLRQLFALTKDGKKIILGPTNIKITKKGRWVVFDNGICVDLNGVTPEKNGNPLQFKQSKTQYGETVDFPVPFSVGFKNSNISAYADIGMAESAFHQLILKSPVLWKGNPIFSQNYLHLMHALSSSFMRLYRRSSEAGKIALIYGIALPIFSAAAPSGVEFGEISAKESATPQEISIMAVSNAGLGIPSHSKTGTSQSGGIVFKHSQASYPEYSSSGGKASASQKSQEKQSRKISAIIFDLDGVLVNSEPLHMKSFAEVFGKGRVKIAEDEWYAQYAGTGSRNVIEKIMKTHNISGNVGKLLEQRKNLYQSYVLSGMVKPQPGALELAAWAKQNNLKTIVASGSHRENVDASLSSIGLSGMKAVAFEDVALQKPHPDLFLKAAQALGVPPSQCLVIEDSPAGVLAARRAGMGVLLVSSRMPLKIRKMATKAAKSLDEKSLLTWLHSLAKGKKKPKKPWKYSPPTRKK